MATSEAGQAISPGSEAGQTAPGRAASNVDDLAWSTLTIDEWASMTVDQWASETIDPVSTTTIAHFFEAYDVFGAGSQAGQAVTETQAGEAAAAGSEAGERA